MVEEILDEVEVLKGLKGRVIKKGNNFFVGLEYDNPNGEKQFSKDMTIEELLELRLYLNRADLLVTYYKNHGVSSNKNGN